MQYIGNFDLTTHNTQFVFLSNYPGLVKMTMYNNKEEQNI